jgi:hypothetical protein
MIPRGSRPSVSLAEMDLRLDGARLKRFEVPQPAHRRSIRPSSPDRTVAQPRRNSQPRAPHYIEDVVAVSLKPSCRLHAGETAQLVPRSRPKRKLRTRSKTRSRFRGLYQELATPSCR